MSGFDNDSQKSREKWVSLNEQDLEQLEEGSQCSRFLNF
jgi:hypothetical protein